MSWLFCVSAAEERGLSEPSSFTSVEVAAKDARRGRRLHVFDRRTKCPVYNAVTGMGANAAGVRVRRNGGEISHRTMELSGWALGAGWIRPFAGHGAEHAGLPDPRLEPNGRRVR